MRVGRYTPGPSAFSLRRIGAKGWRAYHGRREPEDQSETFVFCPECAEQEFGDSGYA